MHDPLVVACTIRRPWPQLSRGLSPHTGRRWKIGGAFWTVAGRPLYWPALITIWHQEPGGHDSGEVCKHYRRRQDDAGKWQTTFLHTWKWHVHHWKVQIIPLQALRRWALTRCEWCGGRSRKGDYVNVSRQWDPEPGRWWHGERGLYHHDCTSVERAHALCFCDDPLLSHPGYGACARCGKARAWRQPPNDADWLLRRLPTGSRIPASLRPELEAAWERARKERANA
jgi:hypothetical protein